MVRTGLEKSWNLTLDLKSHGILCWPGKMTFCLEKSLKISGSHWKISCAMLNLILIWKHWWLYHVYDKKCHFVIKFETILVKPYLHSRATCYIIADSWTTCYIVRVKPCQAAYAGKVSMVKAPCIWLSLVGSLWCKTLHLTGKNQINMKQIFLQSTVQICMFDDDAFQWAKPIIIL